MPSATGTVPENAILSFPAASKRNPRSRLDRMVSSDCSIGDLIADAIRDATGAEIGLVNGGGIRGDRVYPAGAKLTRRDALTELPFNNVTVMIELKGSATLTQVPFTVSLWFNPYALDGGQQMLIGKNRYSRNERLRFFGN